jgi:hypothetical protein
MCSGGRVRSRRGTVVRAGCRSARQVAESQRVPAGPRHGRCRGSASAISNRIPRWVSSWPYGWAGLPTARSEEHPPSGLTVPGSSEWLRVTGVVGAEHHAAASNLIATAQQMQPARGSRKREKSSQNICGSENVRTTYQGVASISYAEKPSSSRSAMACFSLTGSSLAVLRYGTWASAASSSRRSFSA